MKNFIITVDTEGDYIWHTINRSYGERKITVENAKYIERFQNICNKYDLKPTYLVNFEMAFAAPFVDQAKDWAKRGECEIGMHLHSWNTPPEYPFPYHRKSHNPYAGDYPAPVMMEKMKYMTDIIERQFHVRPISHRGGRWYFDGNVLKALSSLGYIVDCSVTPGVSWADCIGYRIYGSDHRKYPNKIFWIKHELDIILEIPPTIIKKQCRLEKILPFGSEKVLWLRPNALNLNDMLYIVEKNENDYLEFMIHSSELMPDGSPTFRNTAAIEKLYSDMEILFSKISVEYKGISLGDFAKNKMNESHSAYDVSK